MKSLILLVNTIKSHQSVNNQFYDIWMNEELSAQGISIFARNYWEWAYQFPIILAGLIARTENIAARTEYTKTLFSEMGDGDVNRVHSTLFEVFHDCLTTQMGNPQQTLAKIKHITPLLNGTQKLISWQKEVYSTNPAVAVGAQLALEWQAYTMLSKLYEGARNYMHLWKNMDDFHGACEFFYAHIGAAEKEHKKESINAAERLIHEGAPFADIELGFNKNLELIANFWADIANEVRPTAVKKGSTSELAYL
ncbi:MAG: hypothetical protein K0R48_229 [Gammaproteobacteria bacterium]|nr:hypothetical protein [Gammaproteobacteria bacterium]